MNGPVSNVASSRAQPRRLLPVGWVTVAEAIAWVGFAQAVPVQQWDAELALGLSFWPWHRPSVVKLRLRRLAEFAVLRDLPYTREQTPGHRTWLIGALRELGMHRRMVVEGPITSESPDHILRAGAMAESG
jgi:hypothetical protein